MEADAAARALVGAVAADAVEAEVSGSVAADAGTRSADAGGEGTRAAGEAALVQTTPTFRSTMAASMRAGTRVQSVSTKFLPRPDLQNT